MRLITFLLSLFKNKEIPQEDVYITICEGISNVKNLQEARNMESLISERVSDPIKRERLRALLTVITAGKGINKVKGIIITSN